MAIHSACLTLAKTSPAIIGSMNVVITLADFPLPATSAVDAAERIAAEYGLTAAVEVKSRHFEVRLQRGANRTR